MRTIRILLLFVITAALAAVLGGVFAPNAKALAFEDEPCPPDPVTGVLKICKPDAEVGKPYSLPVRGRAGCTPDSVVYSLPNGSLPPGLTMSTSNAQISGTPTKAGQYRFWIRITDIPAWQGGVFWCSDAETSDREFQVTVVQGLQIAQRQSSLPAAQLSTPYNLQLTATGGTGLTWSVTSGALPAGITLNPSTGLLSGTPTQVGDATFQIKVTDGSRADIQTYTMSSVNKLELASFTAPAAETGVPFQLELKATGGRGPYQWSATGLPSGLVLDPATGAISGTAAVAGPAAVKVTVTDSLGLSTSVGVNLAVAQKLALVKKALPQATVGRAYAARLTVSGGVRPLTWVAVGGAPGLKLNATTGALSGIPRKAGTYRLSVRVRDKLGVRATAFFVLKVRGQGAAR